MQDLQRLQEIASSEDPRKFKGEVEDMRATAVKAIEKAQAEDEELEEQEAELEEQGADKDSNSIEEEIDSPLISHLETIELCDGILSTITNIDAEEAKSQNENLKAKEEILEAFRGLIQTEENLKVAFEKVGELREKWKTIGVIPRDKHADLQNEYAKLNETFYYNINIYKELKEHDLKRNFSLKNQIVHQLEDLQNIKDIKTVEAELHRLRNEWEEIGGTYKDKWEIIKERYWEAVRNTYKRIGSYYEDRRKEYQENLEAKQALVEKAKKAVENECTSHKEWNKVSDKLKALQQEWKEIGFSDRKRTQAVWKEFRGVCNDFFEAKKEFFGELKGKYDQAADKKEALIKQAEELKNSTDWEETSKALITLQKQWKKIPHAGPHKEHKLWKSFRNACDAFFNARDAEKDKLKAELSENLKKKQAFIEEVKKAKLPAEKEAALEQIKTWNESFNAIGEIPYKQAPKVTADYEKALKAHMKDSKLSEDKATEVLFKSKVEAIAESGDDKSLEYEKRKLQKELKSLKDEVIQAETNMGFFNLSKGAEGLLTQVQSQLEEKKKRIEELEQKIRFINKTRK